MEFNEEKRSPTLPLSMENKELARNCEFLIDYSTNLIYVKNEDGEFIDLIHSEATWNDVAEYLKTTPDTLTSILIQNPEGEWKSIQETFAYVYSITLELSNKKYRYAGSETAGGAAYTAKRLNSYLNIINHQGDNIIYNGSEDASVEIKDVYSTSGGNINGDVDLLGKLILTMSTDSHPEGSYGTKLPETGVDGQIFILIETDT